MLPLFIIFSILIGSIFICIFAKVLLYFDYVIFALIITVLLYIPESEHFIQGILVGRDIHTVFVILIYIAGLAVFHALQQIRIFNIYIFRILSCAFASFVLTMLIQTGLFGETLAHNMDTIWAWFFGIVYFIIMVVSRVRNGFITSAEKSSDNQPLPFYHPNSES